MAYHRSIGAITIAVAVALAVAGCSSGSSTGTGSNTVKLVTAGELTIGYAPSVTTIDVVNGKVVGPQGILINEIAKRMHLKPVYESYDFAALVPALQSHRIDVLVDGFSITQPRADILTYMPPTYFGLETLIVKPGTPGAQLTSWEQAAKEHLTLSTTSGSYEIADWQALGINTHVFQYASLDSCLQDVLHQASAGCALGSLELLFLKATDPSNPEAQLQQNLMTGPLILADLNGMAVAQDNPGLANELTAQINTAWRDGSVTKAWEQSLPNTDVSLVTSMPAGQNYYLPGPWQPDVTPPASTTFASVTTVTSGKLTVGVTADSTMLKLSGSTLSGPEATILQGVASRLGLTLTGVHVASEESALKQNQVDLLAGELATTPQRTKEYWMTEPIGFNPDYMYVVPDSAGNLPTYTSWDSVKAANGTIAVTADSPRLASLQADGVKVATFSTAQEALEAVVSGAAQAFVGTTSEYAQAVSSDPTLAKANIQWIRNTNVYTTGDAYAWGVKAGNTGLLNDLNQAITLGWQQGWLQSAYNNAWPGANETAIEAPGPTAVGTSFGSSEDYVFDNIFISGPWLQTPGYAGG